MQRFDRFSFFVCLGLFVATAALAGIRGQGCQAASPTQAASDGLPGTIVPEGLGVNIHFTDPRPGEMEMLAAAGFRWIRMDFGWEGIEREKGKYDFCAYDRLISALEKHHVRAVFILDYANQHYDRGQSPYSDEGRQAMARWAAAAARHFRGRGILWEMYNEPNIFFWRPRPDVSQYAKLALEVGRALRAAEPRETYIGPATSTVDFKFLEKCFQAGLLEYWSAVSVHPYRQEGPETAAKDYARLRQLIDRYAPKGKKIPIVSGEWGYSSGWNKFDETRQGKMLPRQFLVNLAHEVPLSIWYDWHDDGQDVKEPEHHFGTVHFNCEPDRRPIYTPKPAYTAAQTLTTMLDGFRFDKRLPQPADDDYAYVFTTGSQRRFAAWTTAQPHPVKIATGQGQFTVVSYLGEKSQATAHDGSVKITLTDAPQYILPRDSEPRISPIHPTASK
jgi:polysaccharide biosynthesis protein PslG